MNSPLIEEYLCFMDMLFFSITVALAIHLMSFAFCSQKISNRKQKISRIDLSFISTKYPKMSQMFQICWKRLKSFDKWTIGGGLRDHPLGILITLARFSIFSIIVVFIVINIVQVKMIIIPQVLRGALWISWLARQAARWRRQMLSYKTPGTKADYQLF